MSSDTGRGDVGAPARAPAPWAIRAWERTLRLRIAGIALIALAAGTAGGLDAVLIVVGCSGLATVLQARSFRRNGGRIASGILALDLVTAVAVVLVEPAMVDWVAMVMVAVIALTASAHATRPAIITTVVGSLCFLALETAGQTTDGVERSLAFGVAGLLVILGMGTLVESERVLQRQVATLVTDLDAVLWTRHPRTHRITYVTGRVGDLLGFAPEDWTRPGFWTDRLHPEDRDRVLAITADAVAKGIDHEVTYRLIHADGRVVHVNDRVSSVEPGASPSNELHGVTVDVSARHAIEQERRQYSDIVEHIDLALLVARVEHFPGGAELRIVSANPASETFLDRPCDEAVGHSVVDLLPYLDRDGILDGLLSVARRGHPLRADDVTVARGTVHRSATIQAFLLPGDLIAIALQDTTEITTAARTLRRQALHDALTGLPNRAHLDEHVRDAVPEAMASGTPLALLVMDLDQFKEVNDALGHAVGDRLLIAVADRLRSLLGATFVARMGGDEFAIVMSGERVTEEYAERTAANIAHSLSSPFLLDDLRLQTNVSIGIALVPHHAVDADELVRRADVAMYVAKGNGAAHSVYRPDEDHNSVARLTLIGDLRDAVSDGQLVVHYQPVLDLLTGEITRAEALVRWQHPRLGLLGPDEFIGLAAVSGATHAIARWVLEEATQATARWRALGHEVGVAVNLSVRNLFDRELTTDVERALLTSGLEPADLVLELTETQLMDDPSVALATFRALRAIGVGTSVDDFGTGYSSMTYLRDLPLTELKIDRSFIADLRRRDEAYTIVRSMIDLGHNLGLEVVAEGVEDADDLPTLIGFGCDRAQGFHIARPMPETDLIDWLTARSAPRLPLAVESS
ncbi:MAG: EAL domain-containing protein [Acidimicrobiales bacterium]|nr:EAL domain-containing protein [Acidimicrobiales bacterium]